MTRIARRSARSVNRRLIGPASSPRSPRRRGALQTARDETSAGQGAVGTAETDLLFVDRVRGREARARRRRPHDAPRAAAAHAPPPSHRRRRPRALDERIDRRASRGSGQRKRAGRKLAEGYQAPREASHRRRRAMGYFSWFFGLMGKRKTKVRTRTTVSSCAPRAETNVPSRTRTDDPASPAARTPSPTRSSSAHRHSRVPRPSASPGEHPHRRPGQQR
jgi:hypothetical protein